MEKPAPTVYERLELIADRLATLFNGDRAVPDNVPAAHALFQQMLNDTDYEFINVQKGPILENMMRAGQLVMDRAKEDREDRDAEEAGEEVADPGPYPMPSEEFFAGVGWLAYASQDDLGDYDVMQTYLEAMVSEKAFRALCPPLYFALCILLLEKLNHALDPTCTSEDYLSVLDASLEAVFFYLYERTDVPLSQMLLDNAGRIMRCISPHGDRKPKFWPTYLRIFVTRCLRTRELPFAIQQTCYKLVCQAAWILGPRFWTSDEQFVRTLAAMCAVHWRLMLEGLAEREPLVAAYSLFLEIFLVCEERNRISDQTAICVASNCKEILETVAGYIKGEDQNPKALIAEERYVVCALLSTLVSTGAFQMIHEEDEGVIVDWWLKHSVEQSDVFRQLMLCCTFVKKLDGRVVTALAAYYERALQGAAEDSLQVRRLLGQECAPPEPDLMVMHWVMKLVQEKRTDFYDKASLSDAVARLERVKTPKKYLDQLKNLKC